jgi:hypothetical protein
MVKDSEIKQSLLEGLMNQMDDMSSERFGDKPDAVVKESSEEVEPKSDLREAAQEIYNIISGSNGMDVCCKPCESEEPPKDEAEAEHRAMEKRIDAERKASEQKIKDIKMDKLVNALCNFIDRYKSSSN